MIHFPALTNRLLAAAMAACALGVLLLLVFQRLSERMEVNAAKVQLQEIYTALAQYEHRNGALPVLDLYPANPISGAGSIRFELSRYVRDPDVFVSPAGHPYLRRSGLTYLWNPALNGQPLHGGGTNDWMLMDIQALDPRAPQAHPGGYLTLFRNGDIRLLSAPPESLIKYRSQ